MNEETSLFQPDHLFKERDQFEGQSDRERQERRKLVQKKNLIIQNIHQNMSIRCLIIAATVVISAIILTIIGVILNKDIDKMRPTIYSPNKTTIFHKYGIKNKEEKKNMHLVEPLSHHQVKDLSKNDKNQDDLKSLNSFFRKNQTDYDTSLSFNLWDLPPSSKQSLLEKFGALQSNRQEHDSKFMKINYGKNVQFSSYSELYERDSEEINWSLLILTNKQKNSLQGQFSQALKRRTTKIDSLNRIYQHLSSPTLNKNITGSQFLNAIDFSSLTGNNFKKDVKYKEIYLREKQYYNKKYRISDFKKEIHVCIVTPTFNNTKNHRYIWNIESILQQEYKNYRQIIIDDASPDGTASEIAKYLKWRGVSKDKVVLIKNKIKKTAMENIYYAAHKYCDYNQILMIVDGDDELIGAQVFSLFNSLYQSKKYYVLYSNHLYYDQNLSYPLKIGISQAYPLGVKKNSSYRTAYHSYSHLRSMLSDVFLLQRSQSLKDEKGDFYWTICDNAMQFAAQELSCGLVDYVSELTYWYNANTGMNDRLTPKIKEYEVIRDHISSSQKHYHCINHIFKNISQFSSGKRI